MQYDIIGDIHGHANKLENLLLKLGYEMKNGIYQQQGHQTVFVGDFIDRGNQNRRTIEIVRNMVKYGDAQAVMGNHEYNAVCYHTLKEGSEKDYLRPHTQSKFKQHEAFLKEYPLGQADTKEVIDWFRQLPLFLEFNNFRVVHACWDQPVIDDLKDKYLDKRSCLKKEFWAESADHQSQLYSHIEKILKGEEADLPDGELFHDKDGNKRRAVRIKWWGDLSGICRDVAFGYDPQTMSNFPPVHPTIPENNPVYSEHEKPVFFGHYWQTGIPVLQQDNLCCLDYSAGKGGDLVCYRLQDSGGADSKLDERNFIY